MTLLLDLPGLLSGPATVFLKMILGIDLLRGFAAHGIDLRLRPRLMAARTAG